MDTNYRSQQDRKINKKSQIVIS